MLDNVKISHVLGYFAAAQTNKDCDIIDMQGYDGVIFVASFGTMVSGSEIDLIVAHSDTNSTGDMDKTEAEASATSDGTDDVQLIVDVYRPQKRYLEAQVEIDTEDAEIENVIAIQYRGSKMPIEQPDAILDSATFASPDTA
jgi:hypothetical protein